MRSLRRSALLVAVLALAGCASRGTAPEPVATASSALAGDPARFWNAATIYFLLTDRFRNGDPGNDGAQDRRRDGALLRNFEGGDLAGIRHALEAGYFDSLGVTALWLTPFVEQVVDAVDEGGGTGRTYGYHGYWTRDWTAVEPALGTEDDLRALVDAAHRRGIRVLMDAVINHTGPVTARDPVWPADWVRTAPQCTYRSYTTTADCTLVANLPDILTDSDAAVSLPPALLAKWEREGRRDREVAELDAFFRRTGYPRAPRYYLVKWLTDWVREFGFDGYRVDTSKHFGESVSAELRREADRAFADWKRAHPDQVLDDLPFYMMGEVYGWELGHGRQYDFGDRAVDYFAHGYDGLINFGFKREAAGPLDSLFSRYAAALHTGPLRGVSVVNYASSHDDGGPLDRDRRDPLGTGTRLLLAPGAAQIYYGDETARPLRIPGAEGDANLRSVMNWDGLRPGSVARRTLDHWRRIARFRQAHPAVGAGVHRTHQAEPYVFSRSLEVDGRMDRVLVALGLGDGPRTVPVFGLFAEGTPMQDGYSGARGVVRGGLVALPSGADLVLLAPAP